MLSENVRGSRRFFAIGAISAALAIWALLAGDARAASSSPSTAAQLSLGVPYSSTIDRDENRTEWLKLPAYMRPGDTLTLASDSSWSSIRYCLVPNVDDFGQQDAEDRCGTPGYTGEYPDADVDKGKFRRTLEWSQPAGPGFLLVAPGCGACANDVWTFSVTVEQVVTRVNIGTPTLARSSRSINLVAATTFGDNTPAADGIPGRLLWRTGNGGDFQELAQAVTSGGRLAFSGTLPPEAAGRTVALSACVDQVGGGEPQCSTQSVKVAADPFPALSSTTLKLNARRVISPRLACAPVFAPTGCQGVIELRTRKSVLFGSRVRKVRIVRHRFAIPAGATTPVALKVGKRQARLLRKQRRARSVRAIVKLDGRSGSLARNARIVR